MAFPSVASIRLQYGPWVAIDADVNPDPFGLAGDSLYESLNF